MNFDLKKEFYLWIIDWEKKLAENEWYFAEFQEKIVKELNEAQSFAQIPAAIELVLEQTDKWLLGECFDILLLLCSLSKTTEIQPFLLLKWNQLEYIASCHNKYLKTNIEELKRHYRKYD